MPNTTPIPSLEKTRGRILLPLLLAMSGHLALRSLPGNEEAPASQTAPQKLALPQQRDALERLNFLIGDWKGVGQPRRGSRKGAWGESGRWAWEFQKNAVAVVFHSDDARAFKQIRITCEEQPNRYRALALTPQGERISFSGQIVQGQLILREQRSDGKASARLTLKARGELRLIALHERAEQGKEVYYRVAEVGYTRKGKRLAIPGGGQPQCIVTGGLGTMIVTYQGKAYYVCCSGCRQAFEDDPEGILREYHERQKKARQPAAP